ncbi:MAG TPA: 16S rRNA processing protein RimM [Firmicutes bacterium]|nr:16S rRNA processing protein RimM [Bacillota bacterium]
MDKVYVGYVGGVHGLRGDLKIKCKFESPEAVFIKGQTILLNEEPHEITNAKFYKGFYLVTIDNMKDINLVEKYKGYDVYIDRSTLKLDKDYILSDLYDMEIVENGKCYGKVKEILENGSQKILVVDYKKSYMIPMVDAYVKNVDLNNRQIEVEGIEGLIL